MSGIDGLQRRRRAPDRLPPVDVQCPQVFRQGAQEDVLGDGQTRHQGQLLRHHADAVPQHGDGVTGGKRGPVLGQRARVRRQQAGQDIHERAFAGPVLPDQGMDFAALHVEGDVVERLHPREIYCSIAFLKPATRPTWLGAVSEPLRIPTLPFLPMRSASTSPRSKPSCSSWLCPT